MDGPYGISAKPELDENLEKPALNFEADLMDGCLDLVGEVFVLIRQGHGHPQFQVQGEPLISTVDGTGTDSRLKSVGGAHGVSPDGNYGEASCVRCHRGGPESHAPSGGSPAKYPILCEPPLVAHQLAGTRNYCQSGQS